jgi:aminoglycoside phosphotransferase (APT) family kinase protein
VIAAVADDEWGASTVVHRDLYEEQVLVGERIGLIDLDDAALGPPELDVGNLLAHVDLLARRSGIDLDAPTAALLDGYGHSGPHLDTVLLARCRALTLLRLACIHEDASLVDGARAVLGAPDRAPVS